MWKSFEVQKVEENLQEIKEQKFQMKILSNSLELSSTEASTNFIKTRKLWELFNQNFSSIRHIRFPCQTFKLFPLTKLKFHLTTQAKALGKISRPDNIFLLMFFFQVHLELFCIKTLFFYQLLLFLPAHTFSTLNGKMFKEKS